MTIEQITSGSWCARWSNWTLKLRDDRGEWKVTVRRGVPGEADACSHTSDGFLSPQTAVTWACDKMRTFGAKVMILGKPSITLESLLRFTPAPEACA